MVNSVRYFFSVIRSYYIKMLNIGRKLANSILFYYLCTYNWKNLEYMRVYVLMIFTMLFSVVGLAVNVDDDDQEVTLVGDKNYSNNDHLIYDGIDVSNYQKDIDWRTTAKDDNIKFVYIKATEGATHKQHRYRRNIENARRHGIKVGSYHFMTTTASVQSQFENFISVALPEEQDLVPLLDVEKRGGWTIKQLQDSVMKFAILLEQHYGCKPMIYASSSYFNNYLGSQFAHYPLFIARYAKSEPSLYYGAKWILWQFSDRGRIDGIDALVDLSRFNRGYSVKDITYRNNVRRKVRRDNGEVPRPKVRHQEKPEVPMSPKQRREMENNYKNKEKTEAQKRGEEAEKKRLKEEEKRRKEEAKRAEEQRKAEEKKRKEIEKRQKEIEKKHKEEERKRLEEERKRQEQERKRQDEEAKKRARNLAQDRMRADKDRANDIEKQKQQQQEQQRRDELQRAKEERLKQQQQQEQEKQQHAAERYRNTVKPPVKANQTNQSSADNDEIHYNTRNKSKSNK